MTTQTSPSSRLQRILAYAIAVLVVASLLAIIALIAGFAFGAATAQGTGQGFWPAVMYVPMFGLPLAFILVMVLLVISLFGRRRAH